MSISQIPTIRNCNPLPPKGGSLLLKPDSPIEGSSSLWIIELPSGIEPSGICSLPLPAKAGSPTETECGNPDLEGKALRRLEPHHRMLVDADCPEWDPVRIPLIGLRLMD